MSARTREFRHFESANFHKRRAEARLRIGIEKGDVSQIK